MLLFCVAVNLLGLDDLENIVNELDKNTSDLLLKEKAAYAAGLFQKILANRNINLKLRKKRNKQYNFFPPNCNLYFMNFASPLNLKFP